MSGESNEELGTKFQEQIAKLIKAESTKLEQTLVERGNPVTALTLRFHLLTEHYLGRIISAKLPRGDRFVDARSSTYAPKLTLVHALEILPDQITAALKSLNKLRNEMSHQRDFVVTAADIEKIGAKIGRPFMDLKRNHDVSDTEEFAGLTYLLLAGSLIKLVITAEHLPGMMEEFHQDQSKK